MSIEKVLPVDGQPLRLVNEVTALFGWGRLLLFYDLDDQTCKADKYKTKLKQFIKGYHIDHPLSYDQGREVSPLKKGQTAYRYWQHRTAVKLSAYRISLHSLKSNIKTARVRAHLSDIVKLSQLHLRF